MQITCIKVERGALPADGRWQAMKADFLLNDTGIVLKDCQCVWDTQTGASVVTPANDVGFLNVFFQTSFSAMATQAALLLFVQQGPPPVNVKDLPFAGLVQ